MELKDFQARALIGLAFRVGGRVEKLSELKPKLELSHRQRLLQEKLVEVSKGPRGAKSMELTETGWRWVSENLQHSMPKGSEILADVLKSVSQFLAANDIGFGDFVSAQKVLNTQRYTDAERSQYSLEISDLVLSHIHQLTGGSSGERVRLADLKSRLGDVPKKVFDRALLDLQNSDSIALGSLDFKPDIRQEDEEAAVMVGGEARHILYLRGQLNDASN